MGQGNGVAACTGRRPTHSAGSLTGGAPARCNPGTQRRSCCRICRNLLISCGPPQLPASHQKSHHHPWRHRRSPRCPWRRCRMTCCSWSCCKSCLRPATPRGSPQHQGILRATTQKTATRHTLTPETQPPNRCPLWVLVVPAAQGARVAPRCSFELHHLQNTRGTRGFQGHGDTCPPPPDGSADGCTALRPRTAALPEGPSAPRLPKVRASPCPSKAALDDLPA